MLSFLKGTSETAQLIRQTDWASSPLGASERWSTALKTLAAVMLGADQPMFVVWGKAQILLYNDAYSRILADRHPEAMGRPFLDVWDEVRSELIPIVNQAYAGEAVHMDDIALTMLRNGRSEVAHFSFSYTPMRGKNGDVEGFFCPCNETTGIVAAKEAREREISRQLQLFEQAPGFSAVLAEPEHRFQFANAAYRKLIGGRDPVGRTVREALPELAGQPFYKLLDRVYTTGERHVAHDNPISIDTGSGNLEEHFLDFIYEPSRDDRGSVSGIFVQGHDVTEAHRTRIELRESEERLRLIVDGAKDYAVLTMTEDRRITSWSAGAEAAFGATSEAAIGRLVDDFFVPEDRASGAPQDEAGTALATGYAPDLRWHQRDDGSRVFINGSVHLLPANEGRQRELLKIGRDETKQRRHEEELARTRHDLVQSEERFRTALQIETVGAIYFDSEGQIFDANDAFLRMSGYTREDLENGELSWQALTPAEWMDDSHKAFSELLTTGSTVPYEKEYIRKDGKRWWALFAAKLLPGNTGFEFVLDISDRKRAEAELRLLNERLESRVDEALAERRLFAEIVESTDLFIQVLDPDFRLIAINDASQSEYDCRFGVRPDVGDCLLDYFIDSPEQHDAMRDLWQRALDGEAFVEISEFGGDLPFERRTYEMTFRPLRDGTGQVIGAYHISLDVTDRLQAQAKLASTQDALRQSQKMEAVGQLTGGVAHDFNNLLTIIKGSSELLRRPDLPEPKRVRYIEAISDTVDRASKLTGQLLAFARRQALKPELFDAAGRIRGISDMLRTIMGSRVEIAIDYRCDPCMVEADASQFETALVNMAVNARDAMDGEGKLSIQLAEVKEVPATRGHAAAAGEYIAVSISDTGVGIPADRLNSIFEPFYTTKEVGRGTGLGLSQVFGFAKQSNGNLRVESTPGEGATFFLYLPHRRGSQPVDLVNEQADAATSEAAFEAARGQRILVVEDNVEVGRFSTQILEDLGYQTTWAANGREALHLLDTGQSFDAVFSDVVMPGMSGVELGRELRRRHPDLPVILTSGYSHILAEGRQGFELLQKPYAAEDLARLLRRILGDKGSKQT